MNPELIEKITRSIVEKLEKQSSFEQSFPTDDRQSSVTFWAHTSSANKKVINGPLAEVVEDDDNSSPSLLDKEGKSSGFGSC